ncbi:hypothetical protein [Nocardia sp. NBC_01388]|uniref:hypothetical protein n=1 Tax=Nocardia sp. NBC_01388 TaxID=2903596 RepID=UPI0032522FCC
MITTSKKSLSWCLAARIAVAGALVTVPLTVIAAEAAATEPSSAQVIGQPGPSPYDQYPDSGRQSSPGGRGPDGPNSYNLGPNRQGNNSPPYVTPRGVQSGSS